MPSTIPLGFSSHNEYHSDGLGAPSGPSHFPWRFGSDEALAEDFAQSYNAETFSQALRARGVVRRGTASCRWEAMMKAGWWEWLTDIYTTTNPIPLFFTGFSTAPIDGPWWSQIWTVSFTTKPRMVHWCLILGGRDPTAQHQVQLEDGTWGPYEEDVACLRWTWEIWEDFSKGTFKSPWGLSTKKRELKHSKTR